MAVVIVSYEATMTDITLSCLCRLSNICTIIRCIDMMRSCYVHLCAKSIAPECSTIVAINAVSVKQRLLITIYCNIWVAILAIEWLAVCWIYLPPDQVVMPREYTTQVS